SRSPFPSQLFLPLQALSAPAQAPLPLHSLMPPQCTIFVAAFFSLPFSWAKVGLAANKAATADAIRAPFIVFPFSIDPPLNPLTSSARSPMEKVAEGTVWAPPLLRSICFHGYRALD